jgi:hypothetical protein
MYFYAVRQIGMNISEEHAASIIMEKDFYHED